MKRPVISCEYKMLFLSRYLVLISSMNDAYFHDSCNFVRPLMFFSLHL